MFCNIILNYFLTGLNNDVIFFSDLFFFISFDVYFLLFM